MTRGVLIAKRVDELEGLPPGGCGLHPAEPIGELSEGRQDGIRLDVHAEREPVPFAVLREVGDAVADGIRGRPDRDRLPVDEDLAGFRQVRREDRADHLGAAGADETRDPEDLAPVELEADVPHLPPAIEVADLEHHRRIGRLGQLRRRLVDRAADHHADDLLGRCLGRGHRLDVAPVAHDRDPVGDLLELFEPVRDVDDPVASLPKVAGDPEQLVDLGVGERRGGLVHDQDVRVVGQRLRDLDHLLLGHGKPGHARARIQPDVQLLEQRRGLPVERLLVEQEPSARLPADEDVLGDRQVAHQVQLLVDDADPEVLGRPGGGDVLFLSADPDHARIAAVDPGQDLHQGGLARAVLPDETVDLARAQLELRVLERADARKALGDIDHLDQELIHVELLPTAKDGVGAGRLGRVSGWRRDRSRSDRWSRYR